MTIERGTIGGWVGSGDVTENVVVLRCDVPGCVERYVMLESDCGDDSVIIERAETEGWSEDGPTHECSEHADGML